MKKQIQVRTRVPAQITPAPEHSPIYDLDAYLKRQKKYKLLKIRQACIDTLSFYFTAVFTFSFLFLGE